MPRMYGAAFQGGCYLYIDWEYSQNHAANTSTVYYTFGIHFGNYYFNTTNKLAQWGAGPGSAWSSWSESGPRPWPHGGTHQDYAYHSGQVTVYHDDIGDARATVWAKLDPSSAGGGGTREMTGYIDFICIPRLNNPPGRPVITSVSSTSFYATFTDSGGGAMPIIERQLAYGTHPTDASVVLSSAGYNNVTGLTPGTTYYVWARTRNIAGWSGWSERASVFTHRVPDSPSTPTMIGPSQVSVTAEFTPNFDGGTPITQYQIGYSLTHVGNPTTVITANSPVVVTGLSPATTYYFKTRARNAVGWSVWSGPTSATTKAGARIKVGPVWKEAVPYVKVGGVWRLARPWVREAGVWKESQ